jgi:hypothetical protein
LGKLKKDGEELSWILGGPAKVQPFRHKTAVVIPN